MKGEQKWKWKVNRSENERGAEVKMKGEQKWKLKVNRSDN